MYFYIFEMIINTSDMFINYNWLLIELKIFNIVMKKKI